MNKRLKQLVLLTMGLVLATGVTVFGQLHDAQAVGPGLNGKVIFASTRDGDSEIFSMNFDGTNQQQLTFNAWEDITPSVSPDGTKIAWSANQNGTYQYDIFIMNIDGTNTVNITSAWAPADRWPTWSPDGSQIVFMRKPTSSSNFDIYKMNADGTNVAFVAKNGAASIEDCCATWSPDGQYIVFSSNYSGNFDIYRVRPDGTGLTTIANTSSYEGTPSFDVNGNILFRCNCSNADVWRMDINGANKTRITTYSGLDRTPEGSPDGAKIVYSRQDANGNDEIYIANADGTNPVNLTNTLGSDLDPSIQPIPVQ